MQEEKLPVNKEAADSFVASFSEFIKGKNLFLNQVFNCDETGLYIQLQPDVTLAASFEKKNSRWKQEVQGMNVCSMSHTYSNYHFTYLANHNVHNASEV